VVYGKEGSLVKASSRSQEDQAEEGQQPHHHDMRQEPNHSPALETLSALGTMPELCVSCLLYAVPRCWVSLASPKNRTRRRANLISFVLS